MCGHVLLFSTGQRRPGRSRTWEGAGWKAVGSALVSLCSDDGGGGREVDGGAPWSPVGWARGTCEETRGSTPEVRQRRSAEMVRCRREARCAQKWRGRMERYELRRLGVGGGAARGEMMSGGPRREGCMGWRLRGCDLRWGGGVGRKCTGTAQGVALLEEEGGGVWISVEDLAGSS